jgi:hypothetical protein
VNNLNPNIKNRKRLITHYKTYGIIGLKKNVDVDHAIFVSFFEEDINSPIRGLVERQLIKTRFNVLGIVISFFFLMLKILPRKMMCNKKNYCNILVF